MKSRAGNDRSKDYQTRLEGVGSASFDLSTFDGFVFVSQHSTTRCARDGSKEAKGREPPQREGLD